MKILFLVLAGVAFLCNSVTVAAPYQSWEHSGSIFILTASDGADLPVSASEANFPLLVRLYKDYFIFSQAASHGEDIRFATRDGMPLAYEIEQWDAAQGTANIWVRIPSIKGNARQEIKLYWGNANAASESGGSAVFNASNGYVSVWHMDSPVRDDVGTLESRDTGTVATGGIIGEARHFSGGQGIFGGDKIATYPSGAAPHSSEAWFRAERSNTTLLGWGNEGGGRGSKVRMQLRSPPHIHVDSDFSDVNGESTLPFSQWVHVVHTYDGRTGKIYINGRLDGSATPTLAIKSPARLWIGGWYHHYDFVGDIDEVRISSVARSADWVRLEFESQKPQQTLVGPVVQAGTAFSVSPSQATVMEGRSATFTAVAGGAMKVDWVLENEGRQTVMAADRFTFTFEPGRVREDQAVMLRFKASYADGVKTLDIPIKIKKAIPDPAFTLQAPANWDGRATIEVVPHVTNLKELQAAGAGELHCAWSMSDIAVIKEVEPGKLILHRALNSGKLRVTANLDNGGLPVAQSADILVTEPKSDPWVSPTPASDEMPADNQFYARDDKDEGTLYCNGTVTEPAGSVFLRVYADDRPYSDEAHPLGVDKCYAFSVRLKPGLIRYKAEFGIKAGGRETVLHTANNLVCGDAYLIDGQSNAEATSWGNEEYPFTSSWIRSYGSMDGGPEGARFTLWGNAVARGRGGQLQVGYWGMELARRLVEDEKIPICIINGAVGGTRIDLHQRNALDPEDVRTIYGRLLWRVRQAKLAHGIRGVLWHQGENDQGADGPSGGFGWETYRQYFIEMAAGWKQDYPNLQHYYVFQIWPKSCAMGINGSDNRLREVQRTLPTAFSNLSVMSTLGIEPPGGCHYPPAGYAEFARLICPLVERDNYAGVFAASITAPDLKQAFYVNAASTEIAMEFDQPVKWTDDLVGQFYLDGEKGKVVAGTASGNTVTLKLASSSQARKLTYLDSKSWSQSTLLRGQNGIAALTFCDVLILARPALR